MPTHWFFVTRRGTFRIRQRRDGRWQLWHEDDPLDTYAAPTAAAYEIANGYGTWPSVGSPAGLGIPEDIAEWEPG